MLLCLNLKVHQLLNGCDIMSIFCIKNAAVSDDMCVSDAQHTLSGPRSTHAGLPSPQILQSFLTFQDAPCNTAFGLFTN